MQFPFSLFGDLLAEFQKYLTDRISRPVYWATGLIVVALGIIVGYLAGLDALIDAWNKADAFLKLVFSGVVVVSFLLLAYVLRRLQGTVERWFQGDWPRRWQTGALEWHRAVWQERQETLQMMYDLYGALQDALNEMTRWGPQLDAFAPVLRTTCELPRYTLITEENLNAVDADDVPRGALRDRQTTVGMMTLHPIDADTIVTGADVVRLPGGLERPAIIALSVSVLIVPTGLVPGDLVDVYAQGQKKDQFVSFKSVLILDAQQISGEQANGTDVVRLTLAVAPNDVEAFVKLSDKQILRIVRPAPQLTPSPALQAPASQIAAQPVIVSPPPSSPDPVDDQLKILAKEYEAGKQWFRELRAGTVKTEIPSHAEGLKQAFVLIKSLSASASKEQQEKWLLQVNAYRNGWISLLRDAYKEIEYRIDQHKKTFPLYYPATPEKVAPTAIGNVFHAVDSYCDKLYGLDIALVLPRLQVVMEENTRDQLTKAHDQLELFEWLYLGSIVVGLIGSLMAFHAQHYLLALLLWLLVLPVPRIILYLAALKAALDYADALRLAVDYERGKIISQAGFSLPSPTNQEQERELWNQIQQWWVYGTPPGDYILTMEGTSSDTTNGEKT